MDGWMDGRLYVFYIQISTWHWCRCTHSLLPLLVPQTTGVNPDPDRWTTICIIYIDIDMTLM